MPRLAITLLGQPVREIALAGAVSIGRHPSSVVVLLDETVSNAHARFVVEGDDVYVEDLESANGTMVDGWALAPHHRHALYGGERVAIGPFVLDYACDTVCCPVRVGDGPPPHNTRSPRIKVIQRLEAAALFLLVAVLAAVVARQVV